MKKRLITPFVIVILLFLLALYIYTKKESFDTESPGESLPAGSQSQNTLPNWVGILIIILFTVIIGFIIWRQIILLKAVASGSAPAAGVLAMNAFSRYFPPRRYGY